MTTDKPRPADSQVDVTADDTTTNEGWIPPIVTDAADPRTDEEPSAPA